MTGLMLKSVYAEHDGKPLPVLVDLGYLIDPTTRRIVPRVAKRYEALLAFIPRRRFERVGTGERLFVELPPTKAAKIMAKFPINEGSTYWRATHHWLRD